MKIATQPRTIPQSSVRSSFQPAPQEPKDSLHLGALAVEIGVPLLVGGALMAFGHGASSVTGAVTRGALTVGIPAALVGGIAAANVGGIGGVVIGAMSNSTPYETERLAEDCAKGCGIRGAIYSGLVGGAAGAALTTLGYFL